MLKNKLITLIPVYNTQNMWYILTIIYLYILLSEYLKLNLYKTSLFIYHLYLDIFSFLVFGLVRVSSLGFHRILFLQLVLFSCSLYML